MRISFKHAVLHEAGMGGKIVQDILKAFTRRCVRDVSNLANSKSDLGRSNGRCPGCDYITPAEAL